MKKHKKTILTIFLSLLTSLSAAQKPDWVNRSYVPPNSSQMYYAIQSGNLEEESKQDIRNRALANISSQILTQISSEFKTSKTETDELVSQKSEQTITSLSQEDFFGDDLTTKEYIDKNTYWIYIALDKATYIKRLQNRINTAIQMASATSQAAKIIYDQGNVKLAIDNYFSALNSLKMASNIPPSLVQNDDLTTLVNQLCFDFNHMLSSLKIRAEKLNYEYKTSQKNSITFILSSDEKNKNLSQLPVKFRCLEGEADIDSSSISDENGKVVCEISSYNVNQGELVLQAFVNFNQLFSDVNDIVCRLNNPLVAAETTIGFAGPRIRLSYLVVCESNELKNAAQTSVKLTNSFISYLQDNLNARFVEKNPKFELQLYLSVTPLGATLKEFNSNMHSVSTSLDVKVIKIETNELIYAAESHTARNVGLDDIQAFENSLDKLKQPINEELSKLKKVFSK